MVMKCDGYLKMAPTPNPTSRERKAQRFFEIASRVPLEIQMILAKQAYHLPGSLISGAAAEQSLIHFFKDDVKSTPPSLEPKASLQDESFTPFFEPPPLPVFEPPPLPVFEPPVFEAPTPPLPVFEPLDFLLDPFHTLDDF